MANLDLETPAVEGILIGVNSIVTDNIQLNNEGRGVLTVGAAGLFGNSIEFDHT